MRILLFAARFLIELALFAALGVSGAALVTGTVARVVVGIVVAVSAMAVWGVLLSPRRPIRLPLVARLAIELALFAVAGIGLAAAGYPALGVALVVAEVIVVTALWAIGLRPGDDASMT